MRHIKVENNIPIQYSLDQLFIDYPDAIIYKISQMPDEELLENYNVYPLITEGTPELTSDETCDEGVPEFQNGEWHQTWIIRQLTAQEKQTIIDNTPVPSDSQTTDPTNP